MDHSTIDFTLTFNIQSYWHIGSGVEGGAYADALVLKNNYQLPYLPGKGIKGLLKEAFSIAEEHNWLGSNIDGLIDLLFGVEGKSGNDTQGLIQFTSATLSESEIQYFQKEKSARSNLFTVISSTAIDEKSGVAKATSLRNLEVTIPMELTSTLSINKAHPKAAENLRQIEEKMEQWLILILPLITNLGAKRFRGLGQVIVESTVSNNSALSLPVVSHEEVS